MEASAAWIRRGDSMNDSKMGLLLITVETRRDWIKGRIAKTLPGTMVEHFAGRGSIESTARKRKSGRSAITFVSITRKMWITSTSILVLDLPEAASGEESAGFRLSD
jgi:hypothetical protein